MKLVIFDCDGTLVDSQHVIVAGMNRAFRKCGLSEPGAEAIRSNIGLSLMEFMDALLPGVSARQAEAVIAVYREAWLELNSEPALMYDGAEDAVRALAARDDVLLGIATGKSQRGVRHLLESRGLAACFHTIQTADDAPSKPHPGMIERALAETGAETARAVMVGDTVFDMEMAVNAAVLPVGVGWGYHPSEELVASGAHHVLQHFNELEGLIDMLWQGSRSGAAGPEG